MRTIAMPPSRLLAMIVAVCLACTMAMETAHAQLFGDRTLGQPLSGRTNAAASPSAMDSAGALQGDERFLRGNRSRNAFVGSDRRSQQGFVGSDQAIGTGRVRTSVESLREPPDRSAQINRPIGPLAANQMYRPRLSISASEMADPEYRSSVQSKRDEKLQSRLSKTAGSSIQVLHRGDRTVIRGVVGSRSMAEKLRILASFEPQVDRLESQLTIAEPLPQPSSRLHRTN